MVESSSDGECVGEVRNLRLLADNDLGVSQALAPTGAGVLLIVREPARFVGSRAKG